MNILAVRDALTNYAKSLSWMATPDKDYLAVSQWYGALPSNQTSRELNNIEMFQFAKLVCVKFNKNSDGDYAYETLVAALQVDFPADKKAALRSLYHLGLLNQINFDAIMQNEHPDQLASAIDEGTNFLANLLSLNSDPMAVIEQIKHLVLEHAPALKQPDSYHFQTAKLVRQDSATQTDNVETTARPALTISTSSSAFFPAQELEKVFEKISVDGVKPSVSPSPFS